MTENHFPSQMQDLKNNNAQTTLSSYSRSKLQPPPHMILQRWPKEEEQLDTLKLKLDTLDTVGPFTASAVLGIFI